MQPHRTNHIMIDTSLLLALGRVRIRMAYVTLKMTAHPAANMLTSSNVFHSLAM
jgi:hypothetical protein